MAKVLQFALLIVIVVVVWRLLRARGK